MNPFCGLNAASVCHLISQLEKDAKAIKCGDDHCKARDLLLAAIRRMSNDLAIVDEIIQTGQLT